MLAQWSELYVPNQNYHDMSAIVGILFMAVAFVGVPLVVIKIGMIMGEKRTVCRKCGCEVRQSNTRQLINGGGIICKWCFNEMVFKTKGTK